jgi:SAM-dependent methyltransferase
VANEEPESGANDERIYGEAWAARYDDIFPDIDNSAIDFLAGFAGPGQRALELAVGTGRVAIPLALRGIAVTGVDISPAMLAKLSSKPNADRITAIEGDMVDVPVAGLFPLVYIAFNSFFAILSQDRQVQCFSNVASHLDAGGRFVLECFVPDMKRFDAKHRHESQRALESDGLVHSEVSIHHPERQLVDSQLVTHYPDGTEAILPVSIRYAWPAELDLMAQLAGLELESRYEWYDKSPFTADSGRHVSVYRKP